MLASGTCQKERHTLWETVLTLVETHEFTETDGATLMRITQTYQSKEDRDGALASGMDEGMEACYQQLDGVVAR